MKKAIAKPDFQKRAGLRMLAAACLVFSLVPSAQAVIGAAESSEFVINLTGSLNPGAISGYPSTGSGESPAFVINLTGNLNPGAISGYPSTGSAESAVLVLDLRGLGARGAYAESGMFQINLLGLGGGLSVSGKVLDGSTGRPISGARVAVGERADASDETGAYQVSRLAAGTYRLNISKAGYAPLELPLALSPGAAVRRNVTLFAVESADAGPRVLAVSSRYAGTPHFIEKVKALNALALPTDFEVAFTANVDWAGHPLGTVRFLTPTRAYEVAATGSTVTQPVNVTKDFPAGGRLWVKAVAGDETSSGLRKAPMVVTTPPFPWVWYADTPSGSDYRYRAVKLNLEFIKQGVDDGVIPEDLPIFGGKAFKLGFVPEMDMTVNSSGRADLALRWSDLEAGKILDREWGRKHNFGKLSRLMGDFLKKGRLDKRKLPTAAVAGMDLTLFPVLSGAMQHNDAAMRWDWVEGAVGIGGKFKFRKSWPFIFLAGPVPVPVYAKFSLEASAETMLEIQGLEPLRLDGDFQLVPYVRGSLGAGVDQVLAVEGWIGGGANFALQWPEEPTLRELTLYLNGGVTVYALLWTWEKEGLHWDWPEMGGPALRAAQMETPVQARPVSREYVGAADYGRFMGHPASVALRSARAGNRRVQLAALQQQVFPFSEVAGAAHGTNVVLTWLYDDPARAARDRTLLVASKYEGADWQEPQAVADDGTADFHPHAKIFADGSAVVAWENEGRKMPEGSTFEDMLSNLEIAVAWLDPATGAWRTATALTGNAFLDRSPKLAAAGKNDVLLRWIANPANHVAGGADQPNEIWFSHWNGAAWSPGALAATVPLPILKYDLAYDGAQDTLVFSADTDGNLATVADRELYALAFRESAWSGPERLTEDQQTDENPRLAHDAGGALVLTWVKGDTVRSAAGLDVAAAKVIHEAEYSSNLADFQLATDGTGRLAIVWAEPSDYSSDLWAMFYDPALQLWGRPKQLTHDAETERQITPMYFGADMILAAYDRTLVNVQPARRVTASGRVATLGIPKPGRTDLFVMTYQFGQDLALKPNSFYSLPGNPGPGEQPTLWVTVVNEGDRPVTGATIAFYDGDPGTGGSEIGRQTLVDSLRPGDEVETPFEWVVPATDTPIEVYAVIDPDQAFEDADRSNNALSLRLVEADLLVQAVTWNQISAHQLSLTARVANEGAIPSRPARLAFQLQGEPPTELFETDVDVLQPGESRELGFLWDVSDLSRDAEIFVTLLDQLAEGDMDLTNDSITLVIQQAEGTAVNLQFTSLILLPNGEFQVQVIGPTGQPMRIEASDDLIKWTPVWTTEAFTGQMNWTDPESPAHGARFYRAILP